MLGSEFRRGSRRWLCRSTAMLSGALQLCALRPALAALCVQTAAGSVSCRKPSGQQQELCQPRRPQLCVLWASPAPWQGSVCLLSQRHGQPCCHTPVDGAWCHIPMDTARCRIPMDASWSHFPTDGPDVPPPWTVLGATSPWITLVSHPHGQLWHLPSAGLRPPAPASSPRIADSSGTTAVAPQCHQWR